jgi:glycosyltransferase involved in cell wall biosynthesis
MHHVTVIIPAYNPGSYLAEAVHSVVSQTVTDWNLLVINDGSTEPLPDLPFDDDRVEVVHRNNGGPASARNLGLDRATGDLIAFLDADDVWEPTKLERQIAVMDADPTLRLSTTQFRLMDGDGVKGSLGYGRPMSRRDLLATGDGICTSTVMIRRGSERFRTQFKVGEDFDMWLRLAGDCARGYLPTVEVLCRRHDASMTANYLLTWQCVQEVYRAHPDPAGAAGLALYRAVFAHQAWDAARTSGFAGALRHFALAAKISPRTTMGLVLEAARYKTLSLTKGNVVNEGV